MTYFKKTLRVAVLILSCSVLPAQAADDGWSVVPYVGGSMLSDQSANFNGANNIANGAANIGLESGFAAGLSARYDYQHSPWSSEFGWEYRTNDASTVAADGTSFPGGDYASNTFYINGRYKFNEGQRLTPWIGAGLSWIQEIDLDSENAAGENSFSDSGSLGYQVMAGVDYKLTNRLYLTSELRYTDLGDIELAEESGNGQVINLDYQPITWGVGIGYRF